MDQVLIDWLLAGFKAKEGIDLSDNSMALQRLKEEAEKAKKQLSQAESVDITIPFIAQSADGQPKNLQETLSRAQFEKMIDALTLDISGVELGQAIRVRDIQVEDGIEVMNPGGTPVASVEIPRALRSAEAAAEAEGGVAAAAATEE